MANTTNIAINSISEVTDISINSVNMIEAHHWNGTTLNLVWTKGAVSDTWITATDDSSIMMGEYTPTVNMSVSSFSMIQNKNNLVYNYISGIYVKSTNTPVANSVSSGTANVSIVSDGTYLSESKYIHKKSYLIGSYPVLTAGVTYYFCTGERYSAYKVLSGTAMGANAFAWSLVNSTISGVTALATPIYLQVTAV